MAKLWQKEYTLDALMEEFTVGNDPELDRNLVAADCIASMAHAHVLEDAGLLTAEEARTLSTALQKILDANDSGTFAISVQDEDCHTAIESFLVQSIGQAGKKIHTGRSRNDQVQTALRLWMREFVVRFTSESVSLASELLRFAQTYEWIPMPGRTHMQTAMPSSVGLWAASFAEELLDQSRVLEGVLSLLDQSPLGSAASYGTPLPLDRSLAANLMGFSKVQNNVLYANNSRGKFEALVLDGCEYVALTLSKLAQDLILFSLPEFGYFSLPMELCTGSSIMPQKKNPDGLELARSRSAVVGSCSMRVKAIIRSLPSGYNRDFQDTKEPLFTGCKHALLCVRVMHLMIQRLQVNEKALVAGCTSELYATDEVLERLASGGTFRDVYREVGMNLNSVHAHDPYQTIRNRTSEGTTGNLGLDDAFTEAEKIAQRCKTRLDTYVSAYKNLADCLVALVSW